MPAIKSVKVIINGHSGVSDKDEARQTLTNIFEAAGVDSDISLANSGNEVAQLAEHAASQEWTVIVAGGGDGIIGSPASARMRSMNGHNDWSKRLPRVLRQD